MRIKEQIQIGKSLGVRTSGLRVIIFLLLLPSVFFWRETLGRLTLGNADVLFWFFPAWKLGVEQIRSGNLPLWNPYLYSGTALFAEWQAGLLDPLNWIHLLGPTSRTLTIAQQAGFVVALLSVFGFTRRLGMMRRASVISAVIYALSGFAVARTIYPGLFHIYALMPLVLLMIERLYQMGRWRDAALGALIVAWQIFAAHPQPIVYSSLLAAAYALFCAFIRLDQMQKPGAEDGSPPVWQRRAQPLRFLVQCATMFVIGVSLSAVQLAPAWEIAGQSMRQQAPYEFFTLNSLHPLSLLTAVIPFFHGQGKTIYNLGYWGAYWSHNEAQIYLGVVAISLAMACAVCLWRERSRSILFWSLVAALAVVLSLGKYVWPVAWALYHAPALNQFRSPNRHWMEVTMAVSVLAGYAVDRFLRRDERAMARATQVTAAVLTLLCAGVGIFVLKYRDHAESVIRSLPDMNFLPKGFLQQAGAEFYLPVVSAACLLGSLAIFTRAGRRDRWYLLLLASLIIDLNLYAMFAPISAPGKAEEMIGRNMPSELAPRQSEREPIRYHLMLHPAEGLFNPYWFYGHEMATGYDPLINLRYLNFTGINEAGRSYLPTLLDEKDRTLDLLNVKYVLIPASLLDAATIARGRLDYGGISFADDPSSDLELREGQRAVFSADAAAGDTLAIVSTMTNSAEIVDGAEIAEIVAGCESGERTTAMLQAGRDTAEWAYDRSDVRARIKHSRPPLAASWPGDSNGGFQAHSYLARLRLPANVGQCGSSRFIRVTTKAKGNVTLNIKQMSLYDSASGLSTPLTPNAAGSLKDAARWREVPVEKLDFGYRGLRAYENLKAMPRVWLVDRVEPKPDQEQLQLIRGDKAETEGRLFDPMERALIDPADAPKIHPDLLGHGAEKDHALDNGKVSIVKREPARMSLTAEATRPSLLVMSEVTYPGWRAMVDGHEVELLRVNYLLRALSLAPGKHDVEIYYWPRSLTIGAAITAVTALLLVIFALYRRLSNLRKVS